MAWTATYLIPWLLGFVLVGAAIHIADRRYGVPLYRWWYNRSRETKMPESEEMGFIYRRSRKRQRYATYIISGLQSTYVVWTKGVDPMLEIVAFVFEAEIMIIGFWVGNKLYKYLEMRDRLDDGLDNREGIESVNISFAGIGVFFAGLPSRVLGWKNAADAATTQAPRAPEIKPVEAQPAAPDAPDDPRSALDRYTRRK